MGIVVVGSINMDLVVRVGHHPIPGETVLGSDYETHGGGKGANQAVAAARMGQHSGSNSGVRMIGRIGQDEFGKRLRQGLQRENINVNAVVPLNSPTGVAFIAVSQEAQNTIIVSPGANGRLRPENLSSAEFQGAHAVVVQLEIPLDTVKRAAELGREAGAKVILNAAPAQKLSDKLLGYVDVLVVNESEAAYLSGLPVESLEQAWEAARALQTRTSTVVLTLGKQGAIWLDAEGEGYQPSFEVEKVDSTAAGDAFIGAFAVGLCEGKPLSEAVRQGCAAGALATTKAGAQPSLPWRADVEALLKK